MHPNQRTAEISIRTAVEKLLEMYRLKPKVQHARLLENWEQIVGRMVEKHTRDLYLKKDILYIKIDSAVVRQELSYSRTQLVERVNEFFGEQVITDVVLV